MKPVQNRSCYHLENLCIEPIYMNLAMAMDQMNSPVEFLPCLPKIVALFGINFDHFCIFLCGLFNFQKYGSIKTHIHGRNYKQWICWFKNLPLIKSKYLIKYKIVNFKKESIFFLIFTKTTWFYFSPYNSKISDSYFLQFKRTQWKCLNRFFMKIIEILLKTNQIFYQKLSV